MNKELEICIHQRLQEYAMENSKSIIDLHILYDYHKSEISRLYYNPFQHYNKIRVLAYHKTVDEK
jgi:hypothetical protein